MTTTTEALAGFAADFPSERVPDRVVGAARRSLLDAVGVTLAASGLADAPRPFVDIAREASAPRGVPVVGCGFTAPPSVAALANGALAHALDFEDTHDDAIVHPFAAVVPAALSALSGRTGVSGRDFLVALAVGADVACRISLAFERDTEEDGWMLKPVLNAFGAAVAAGRVLGASGDQLENALSLAFFQSVGSVAVKTTPGSDYRAVRDGFNAQAGYLGARLSAAGTVGFPGVLDHPAGIYDLYGRGAVDEEALTGELGTRWESEHVSYKPWPSCRGTHAFAESALLLRDRAGFSVSDVVRLDVRVGGFYAALCEPSDVKAHPRTATDAKFSIPHVLASAMIRGDLALADFAPAELGRADVAELAELVRVDVLPDSPQRSVMAGGVVATLADGRTFEVFVDEPRGGASNPMSDADLVAKFRSCAVEAMTPPRDVDGLIEVVQSLGEAEDARILLDALSG